MWTSIFPSLSHVLKDMRVNNMNNEESICIKLHTHSILAACRLSVSNIMCTVPCSWDIWCCNWWVTKILKIYWFSSSRDPLCIKFFKEHSKLILLWVEPQEIQSYCNDCKSSYCICPWRKKSIQMHHMLHFFCFKVKIESTCWCCSWKKETL